MRPASSGASTGEASGSGLLPIAWSVTHRYYSHLCTVPSPMPVKPLPHDGRLTPVSW